MTTDVPPTIEAIAASELHSANSYAENIFSALSALSAFSASDSIDDTVEDMIGQYLTDLNKVLENKILSPYLVTTEDKSISLITALNRTEQTSKLILTMLEMNIDTKSIVSSAVEFINAIYKNMYHMHSYCKVSYGIQIRTPNINLLQVLNDHDGHDEELVPRFMLVEQTLWDIQNEHPSKVHNMAKLRDNTYNKLLEQGHDCLVRKMHTEAIQHLQRALNYKETVEVLTLLAWGHSLAEDITKAKEYCLRAIELNPDYGPSYNDLGSYLLSEGKIDDSIKWFQLAKRSLNYPNREHPYINMGRAYLMKRNLEKALKEFSMALTLAPYNKELHDMVKKIKDGQFAENIAGSSPPTNPT